MLQRASNALPTNNIATITASTARGANRSCSYARSIAMPRVYGVRLEKPCGSVAAGILTISAGSGE